MDTEEHNGRLWSKISSLFSGKEENIEQAIIEAQEEGELKEEESSMLLSVLELNNMQVSEIMTPRTDIECLPSNVKIRAVADAIVETGHSRLPLFEGTKDNIIGIVYAKDLLPSLVHLSQHEESVIPLLRKVFFVPETKLCSELLQEFRSSKNHIAIVVDEYGGTSGLLTIEDLLEVIVGEIEDEHDAPRDNEIIKIDENHFQLAGRTFLEDLQEININVSSEEVDTIGGYLCLTAGKIPVQGEIFTLDNWELTIHEADIKQIKTIIAKKILEEKIQENNEKGNIENNQEEI